MVCTKPTFETNLKLKGLKLQENHMQSLIIQRKLGFKLTIPGSATWQIIGEEDECWICNRHVLTLLFWTPKIGEVAQ